MVLEQFACFDIFAAGAAAGVESPGWLNIS
jgi:hypothetical protein